jgi:hypothetical protein
MRQAKVITNIQDQGTSDRRIQLASGISQLTSAIVAISHISMISRDIHTFAQSSTPPATYAVTHHLFVGASAIGFILPRPALRSSSTGKKTTVPSAFGSSASVMRCAIPSGNVIHYNPGRSKIGNTGLTNVWAGQGGPVILNVSPCCEHQN